MHCLLCCPPSSPLSFCPPCAPPSLRAPSLPHTSPHYPIPSLTPHQAPLPASRILCVPPSPLPLPALRQRGGHRSQPWGAALPKGVTAGLGGCQALWGEAVGWGVCVCVEGDVLHARFFPAAEIPSPSLPCIPSHARSGRLVCARGPKDREPFGCQSSYFYCTWLEIYELSHVVFISRS